MREQCAALVYKRDTYRRTGRGKTGFEMHYTKCRCSRPATESDLCSQHAKIERERRTVLRF